MNRKLRRFTLLSSDNLSSLISGNFLKFDLEACDLAGFVHG